MTTQRNPRLLAWRFGAMGLGILALLAIAALGATPAAGAPAKTLYTCGMHPNVIEDQPGDCPICGMKLVPMDPDKAAMILEARGEAPAESTGTSATSAAPAAPKKDRKILYWRAPMDPTYIRDAPGKSPMGMDLVPVYADEVAGGPTIRIDPVTEQNMGVRMAEVTRGPLERTIRTVGTINYDEQGLATVTTRAAGWVEKVIVDQTGTQVMTGDPLFEFYSPELYSAQEEFLQDLRQQKAGGGDGTLAAQRLESARDRLRNFGIDEPQIDALAAAGKVRRTMTIKAIASGIVTEKDVVEGDYLKPGQPAYKTADLSTVWVIGRVYVSDMPFVKLGQEAQMTLDYLPGRTYRGRVTYVYPYLEKGTREVAVRMEFHNPGYELKPGMYATLALQSQIGDDATLAPASAIIDTGDRKVAFVANGDGTFTPRHVQTGPRDGEGNIQVLAGLAPGERVVVSGQFLLDSEANLREATLKMLNPNAGAKRGAAKMEKMDGMDMTDGMDGGDSMKNSDGSTASMSSMQSMSSMPSTPTSSTIKYVCPMPSHAGILYDKPGDCPLCGMKLVPTQPWQESASPIAYWTCPMPEHADVHEDKPGKCPKCGMTLIPVTEAEIARFQKVEPKDLPAMLYTCPMPSHADVVSDKPGKCPKCGMTLVPTDSVPHGKIAEEHWREEHAGKVHSSKIESRTTSESATMSMPMP